MSLINREETYKVLTDYYHHRMDIQHIALKEALSRVPSASGWIPVTEKLPEDGRYLCTYQNDEGICVDFGLFANGEWFVEPVAYMPLPEPWKGEDDEVELPI